MKNKAFTLIELLAVIVILAIIALIATSIILNIIEKARKSAFQDTAYGLIETARLEYTEGILDGDYKAKTYMAPFDDLKFSGSKPSGGTIAVGSDGKIAIAIHNNRWCAVKEYEETVVRMIPYEETTCKITGEIPKPVEKSITFEEQMAEQSDQIMSIDPDGNKRYVGKNPKNYVKFNNELWRIIGILDGQVKMIRNDNYSTAIAWHTGSSNDWNSSIIQIELNGTFLNNIAEESRNYIDETHVWKLGGTGNAFNSLGRADWYAAERGNDVWSGRPVEWSGAIALMYPSDYGYSTSHNDSALCDTLSHWNAADSSCRDNSWLYDNVYTQWTLTQRSTYWNDMFYCGSGGDVSSAFVGDTYAAKPVLFLKESVKIKSGTGTSDDPFILTM